MNNAQRQATCKMYKTSLGRDLIDDLKSGMHCMHCTLFRPKPLILLFECMVFIRLELGGHLEDTVVALMREPVEYDAWSLRQAMKGLGTDEAGEICLFLIFIHYDRHLRDSRFPH